MTEDADDRTTRDAVLFPGMGPARAREAGRLLVVAPAGRRLLAIADDALGYPLLDRLADADDRYDEHTQIAFVLVSLALAERAEVEAGLDPVACAGSSFGARAAAVRCGALTPGELVRLVAATARHEADHFATTQADLVSQLVVRTPPDALTEATDGLWHEVSGRFDDEVALVTVTEDDLPELVRRVRGSGGYALTTMRPAAHAPALRGLRDRLASEVLEPLVAAGRVADPTLPLISDLDGSTITTGAGVASLLLESTACPVRLPAALDAFGELGVGRVLVPGPDLLLRRLPALTARFATVHAAPATALVPRQPALAGAS